MKVLHINANYITTALHQTMIEHFGNVIDNIVFAPTYNKDISIIEPYSNVIVSECFKKWDRLLFYYKQKKIQDTIEKEIKIESVDVIHAYTVFTDGNTALELSKKYKKPYVVAVRDTDVNVFFKYMFYLRKRGVEIIKNAKAVFFLSEAYRDAVVDKYIPEKNRESILCKSYIIPNGIDDYWLDNKYYNRNIDQTIERIREKKEIRCIFVGGIEPRKNIEQTLKALKKLNCEGWKTTLTVVGKIKDVKTFNSLNNYREFIYTSQKTREELIKYYRAADIFIMPSHTETFGLVYAEAMSQGLPVIYTRGQGFDRQFEEGLVGYSVSDKDLDELIKRIYAIVSEYKDISKNCTDKVVKFEWNSIVQKYVSIYKGITLDKSPN